jgi:hypothetical protein
VGAEVGAYEAVAEMNIVHALLFQQLKHGMKLVRLELVSSN